MNSTSLNSLGDPIVEAFGDHRLLVEAIPGCLILTAYFIVGTFGNLNIVAATVLNRKLRGTCSYLIAMASIFDSLHMFAHINLSFIVFTRTNLITLSKHLSLGKWRYVPVHFLVCASVSGLFLYLGFLNQQRTPRKYVLCIIIEGVHGYLEDIFTQAAMLINIATGVVYIIVLSLIKKRGADGVTKKIIRSLAWIVAVVTGSWFVTVTIITVMSNFMSLSPPQKAIGIIYSGVFINFGCSCNFFILYKCSRRRRNSCVFVQQ